MSPSRAAKCLEMWNLMAMQTVTNLMAGPRSHSEVAAFRNPAVFEVETSMLRSVEDILLPFLERSHMYFFTGLLVGEAKLEAAAWHNSFSWQIVMLHCQVYSCKWHFSVEGGKIYISPQQFSAVSMWMTPIWSSEDGKSVNSYHNEFGLVCFLRTLHCVPVFLFRLQVLPTPPRPRLGQFKLLGFWLCAF